MFKDEFDYRPKFGSLFFKSPCMKFEGEGDGDGGDGGSGGSGDSWLDDHGYLSDEDKQTLSKYKTQQEAIEATVHSTKKFTEYDDKLKSAVNWPGKETSEEDKASFDSKMATYRGVPTKPEDYKFDRSKTPEGVPYDEGLEAWFRGKMHEAGASQKTAESVYNAWTEMQIKNHQVAEKVATDGEKALIDKYGEDFDVKFGKPGDKENIGTIKQTLLQLSNLLGMDYKDKDKNPQSRLLDALELTRTGGRFGDKPEIAVLADWLHENFFAEGKSHFGQGLTVKGEEGGGDFFDYNDMDGEDEDYNG